MERVSTSDNTTTVSFAPVGDVELESLDAVVAAYQSPKDAVT